jgi:hypothetical protein
MDNVHQRLGKCAQPTAHPLSRTITKLFLDFTQNFLHTQKRHYAEKIGKKRQKHHEISVNVCELRVKFPELSVNKP